MPRRPFGWAINRECEFHRRWLIHDGLVPGSPELHFAVVAAYEKAHADDPTFRQRQEAARGRGEKWATATAGSSQSLPAALEPAEIAYLIDRLDGVNDPVGIDARSKLVCMQKAAAKSGGR